MQVEEVESAVEGQKRINLKGKGRGPAGQAKVGANETEREP